MHAVFILGFLPFVILTILWPFCKFFVVFLGYAAAFLSKNDAPKKCLLAAIALDTSHTTLCTLAVTTHRHTKYNRTVMSRDSSLNTSDNTNSVANVLHTQPVGGLGTPNPPAQKTMPRSSANFLPRVFTIHYRFFRSPPRFFNDATYQFFTLLSLFLRYHSHQIQQKRPASLHLPKKR